MITVSVMINGRPIFTRTAVNRGPTANADEYRYEVDDGAIILHKRADGALHLAHRLLDLIKEQR